MPEAVRITREQARQFLVLRHGLAPPRSLPARAESVLEVIRRLGLLQFDPLEVPGARNHDLVLHARIAGYRRGWCEQWLYGEDRQLLEIYNKSLNMVPICELPYYRLAWTRSDTHYADGILREHADVVEDIVQTLRERGPLSTADFAHHSHAVDWWWAPTRAARAVLEALFSVGRVGVAHRVGNRRFYDLIERLVPAEILARAEPEEEQMRHRLLSRYRAVGLGSPSAQAEVMYSAGTAAERTRRTEEMVESGVLLPVAVEGIRGSRYALTSEREMLDQTLAGRTPTAPRVSFIAPLDPLLWDRRALRDIWSFDYIWEVYVPEQKRRWGYYVLPILYGDRLVGRLEPRLDRSSQTLRILGVWWETGFSPRRAEGFVPEMRVALGEYKRFVGARSVDWASSTAGAGRLFGTLKRG